jgi:hypothetical protein
VSADYFRTLSIPIARGRGFMPHDTAESRSVVIVNEAMARKYWPGEDPVGRRLRLTAKPYGWSEIVGIAGDVREVGAAREVLKTPETVPLGMLRWCQFPSNRRSH